MQRALAALLAALLATPAGARTLQSTTLTGGLTLPYYASATPAAAGADTAMLIAIQGYSRDANRTFDAAAQAAAKDGHAADTLIIAPIFQVSSQNDAKCHFPGVPAATAADALWHCGTWSDGKPALNGGVTSFQAMDQLITTLLTRYPTIHHITLAGFSAGGQYVQRYAAFGNPPATTPIHYVVSDPSSFVYFTPYRPHPNPSCPNYNNWKLGLANTPAYLHRSAADAQTHYAQSSLSYLEGSEDTGTNPDTSYKLLDTSCGAETQGTYRLDRGINYAAYDNTTLAHGTHHLTIIPGCAHSVTCVFPNAAAKQALFGG